MKMFLINMLQYVECGTLLYAAPSSLPQQQNPHAVVPRPTPPIQTVVVVVEKLKFTLHMVDASVFIVSHSFV